MFPLLLLLGIPDISVAAIFYVLALYCNYIVLAITTVYMYYLVSLPRALRVPLLADNPGQCRPPIDLGWPPDRTWTR